MNTYVLWSLMNLLTFDPSLYSHSDKNTFDKCTMITFSSGHIPKEELPYLIEVGKLWCKRMGNRCKECVGVEELLEDYSRKEIKK